MAIIKNIELKSEDGFNIFQATFCQDNEFQLWFRTKAEINPIADVFLSCTLVPCMKTGCSLNMNYEISPLLHNSIDKIQDVFSGWYTELKKIWVRPSNIRNADSIDKNKKEVACFFTGGVDSFYTLLKHNSEITKIIYVHGFDIWLQETEFREMISKRINQIAKELGKELIEVETNILDFSYKICDWAGQYYGSALASVALLLSKTIGKVYIASSLNTEVLYPRGSHPDLDYLWGTEEIEIIHDGCESTRLDKVKVISKNQIVLNHLRVCLDRRLGLYNCSKCEKCIRTMISLYIAGALDKSKTFENCLTPEMISSIKMTDNSLIFARENYNELENGEIKSALLNKMDEYKTI